MRYAGQVSLSDVYPGQTFYEPVRYLYCAGVVSGYPDGTFRPGNATTRAQLTKMVVLAEHWQLNNPVEPTFADVSRDSTFYQYIETASAHGVIAGYPCGGAEPCDPRSRPYFRPNNNVTRAQASKITVLAAGWQIQEPPHQTFADVDWTSPFHSYIETAVAHGAIGGYPCGNPEPCGPHNLPYFRANTSATRGQVAKIVYDAMTAP
jgi:hypothetical protein